MSKTLKELAQYDVDELMRLVEHYEKWYEDNSVKITARQKQEPWCKAIHDIHEILDDDFVNNLAYKYVNIKELMKRINVLNRQINTDKMPDSMDPNRLLSIVNQLKVTVRYVLYNESIKTVRKDEEYKDVSDPIESPAVRETRERDEKKRAVLLKRLQTLHFEEKDVKRVDLYPVVQKLERELYYGSQRWKNGQKAGPLHWDDGQNFRHTIERINRIVRSETGGVMSR